MKYDKFLDRVAEPAGVSREQAETLTRATLQVLAQRISGGEARDIARQLPPDLDAALRPEHEQAEPFDLEVFVQRVADRSFVDHDAAVAGVRAVFQTLREAVTGDEFEDVLAQLPREYAALLDESE